MSPAFRPYLSDDAVTDKLQAPRISSASVSHCTLDIDQIEGLGLAVNAYAETTADAQALMHWVAGFMRMMFSLYLHRRGVSCLGYAGVWVRGPGFFILAVTGKWRWVRRA